MSELTNPTESGGDEPFDEWGIVIPGSACPHCHELGRPRVVKKDPDGKPLSNPYRHFTCENVKCPFLDNDINGRRVAVGKKPIPRCWQVEISKDSLVKRRRPSNDTCLKVPTNCDS